MFKYSIIENLSEDDLEILYDEAILVSKTCKNICKCRCKNGYEVEYICVYDASGACPSQGSIYPYPNNTCGNYICPNNNSSLESLTLNLYGKTCVEGNACFANFSR